MEAIFCVRNVKGRGAVRGGTVRGRKLSGGNSPEGILRSGIYIEPIFQNFGPHPAFQHKLYILTSHSPHANPPSVKDFAAIPYSPAALPELFLSFPDFSLV